MSDFEKNLNNEEVGELDDIIYTLTDDETGEEIEFILIARATIDDKCYEALLPANDPESDEYYIFAVNQDGEETTFESIDDDDEFEKVEEYFNDLLFGDADYDEE